MVPVSILHNSSLSDASFRLLCHLLTYTRPAQQIAYPAQETIAEALSCSTDKVGKALRPLKKSGLVKARQRKLSDGTSTSNEYDLSPVYSLLPDRENSTADRQSRTPKKPCPTVPPIDGSKDLKGVYVKEEHNIASPDAPTDPVSSPPVCVDEIYTAEEKAAITAMESAGFTKGQAGKVVKQYGVRQCLRHIPMIPPSLEKHKRGGWLRRAIVNDYQYADARTKYPSDRPTLPPERSKRVTVPIPALETTSGPKGRDAFRAALQKTRLYANA